MHSKISPFANGITALTLILSSVGVFATPEGADLSCRPPESPLYKVRDVNDALQVQLMANFPIASEHHDIKAGPRGERGVIAVKNTSGVIEYSPVLISLRGKSRRESCEFPPLRIRFVDEDTKKRIESRLTQRGVQPGTQRYLSKYRELFQGETLTEALMEKAKGRGVFAKLGDDVKLVTHCGYSKHWRELGGANQEDQDKKLLSEYYIYKIVANLELPIESVRLAEINYVGSNGKSLFQAKDPTGKEVNYRLAFFREPPKSLAKRCGLLNKPPENTSAGHKNAASYFQLRLVNIFLMNTDFEIRNNDMHNVNALYKPDGSVFYGAYDFDLANVISYDHTNSESDILEKAVAYLRSIVAEEESRELTFPIIQRMWMVRPNMQKVIGESLLDDHTKKSFNVWFEAMMTEITAIRKELAP